MLPGFRSLLIVAASLPILASCGSSSASYSYTSGTAAATGTAPTTSNKPVTGFTTGSNMTGTNDLVAATASTGGAVTVGIGATQTISIVFTSVDAKTITGFGISDSLGKLPAGWSGPKSFACAAVDSGSGCVLNLTYAPTAVGSGTLTLDYIFVDNATMPRTGYSVVLAYSATAHNNVVATASPVGQVNAIVGSGDQPVTVNFTTDDGNVATSLAVTTDLTTLPPGWSTAAAGLACSIISTGSGCQLALIYKPSSAASGVLAINYSYIDDSGTAQTATHDIPYAATTHDTVVAIVSPSGQVNAAQKTGGQSVPVTFMTDDGKTASQFFVTSDLAALPSGWSSTSSSFACGSVNSGNGCQLALTYAPSALASGTFALSYAYTDSSGVARAGSTNISYAATTNDNVVATAAPSGQIVAVATEGSQSVAVTFTTDDARAATALTLTTDLTTLPAGWTSPAAGFSCSGIDTDHVCQLALTYAPTIAGGGMLTLNYAYKNNAGATKTGTLNIAYRATADDNIVGTPTALNVPLMVGTTANVDIAFTTDDGNLATQLNVTSGLSTLPTGWSAGASSFSCATVINDGTCTLSLSYAPSDTATGTVTLGYSYVNNAGFTRTGTVNIPFAATAHYLYVADGDGATVSSCALRADGSLGTCGTTGLLLNQPHGLALIGTHAYLANTAGNSVTRCSLGPVGTLINCQATGGPFSAPSVIAVNSSASYAYIQQATGLTVCNVDPTDGALQTCVAASTAFEPLNGIALSADGTHAYAVHSVTSGSPAVTSTSLEVCSVAANGTFGGCTATGSNTAQASAALLVQNSVLYATTSSGALDSCPINGDATVGACRSTALGVAATGISFSIDGGTAYVSTGTAAVLSCPVKLDGTLASCSSLSDPSFSGTASSGIR